MAQELAGKVAVITGGARGLGRAMVELVVAEGAKVVFADLREDEGRALEGELGGAALFQRADVSRREDVQALVDRAVAAFGRLDAIVNNAGLTDNAFGRLLDVDFDQFEAVMAVNVKGVMLGTQVAARQFVKQGGGGAVVNVSSISGVRPGFGFFSYRASKAAVINFTLSAASELGEHAIRANVLCPGNIPTEMGAFNNDPSDAARQDRIRDAVKAARMGFQPLQRQGSPADIANAAVFLCSDRSAQVTAQVLSVDGGSAATDSQSQIAAIMAARAAAEAG